MDNNTISSRFTVRRIAFLALMVALCQVSRMIFQFLPNVQPVTVILILLTLHLGIWDGIFVATLSILTSNLMLGMGVWTIAQIVSFVMIVLLTGLVIRPYIHKIPFLVMVFYCGLMGFFYGFIISLVQAPFFGIQAFWPYFLAGVPFDAMHAIGNSGFYFILAPILTPLLKKFVAVN
ncbi:ECF transporter S component [Carnobacterium sp. FSL E2-0243]|uniref:ECF transporter S component n=1 Tax=Carnobacterium sp. FSL E2-0243 TaxID=2921365 RepID=UPI0030F521D3